MVDAGSFSRNDLAETARRNHLHIGAFHLLFDLLDDVFHQPRKPEHEPRLHIRDRILTDRACGFFDLDARKFRRTRNKRVHRPADPRRNDTADKFSVFVDDVEGRRRAEIDDNERRAVLSDRRNVVDDAVRAHLARVVHAQVVPRFQPCAHHERLNAEIIGAHMRNGIIERGNDGRNDRPADIRGRDPFDREHVDNRRAVLIARAFEFGRHAETDDELVPVKDPVFNIGISDVYADDHVRLLRIKFLFRKPLRSF